MREELLAELIEYNDISFLQPGDILVSDVMEELGVSRHTAVACLERMVRERGWVKVSVVHNGRRKLAFRKPKREEDGH